MRRLCLPLLFIFYISILQAQTVKFEAGPERNLRELRKELQMDVRMAAFSHLEKGTYGLPYVYDTLNRRAYVITIDVLEKYYNLTSYDNYVSFVETKKLSTDSYSAADQAFRLAEIAGLKGKNYMFYEVHNKDADEKAVYVNELSKDVVVLGSPIKIVSTRDVKEKKLRYFVKASPKNRYVAIVALADAKTHKNYKTITVLNEDMSVVSTRTYEKDQFHEDFETTRWEISDDGNVFEFGFTNVSKQKGPILYSYFTSSDKVVSTEIAPDQDKMIACSMRMPEGGSVPLVVGIFNGKKELEYVVYKPEPSSKSVRKFKTGSIDNDFLGPSRGWQFTHGSYFVRDAVQLVNGDVVFALEPYYVRSTSSSVVSNYYCGPAVLISLNSQGNENWKRLIIKRQMMKVNTFSLGHMLIPVDDQVLVIYNDNPKNLARKPDDSKIKLYSDHSTSVVLQRIDSKGQAFKELVRTSPKEDRYALVTWKPAKISNGVFHTQFVYPKGYSLYSKIATMTVEK